MSLTKVSYSMIKGAPINVLDFGADPTGVADSTTALNNALAAGNNIYIPSGTYKITSISMPNKQVIVSGDHYGGTILNTSGAVGIDFQHVANDNSSRFSQLNNLQIVAAAGTIALRINNLGTHLNYVTCRGGAIGIEYNSGVASEWRNVIAYGSTYGCAFREAIFNLGSQNVIWLCNFKCLATSGNILSNYATGLYVASSITGWMRHCTFDQFDAEQVGTGFEFVNDVALYNTFINAWIEIARDYYGREGTGSQNTWINPRYTPAGLAPTGGIVFSPNSWLQEGSVLFPQAQGGISIGVPSQVSLNVFSVYGPNVAANTAVARQPGLYPYNSVSNNYSQWERFQDVTRGFHYSSISGLTPFDVCTIELNGNGSSFVEVELVENRGAGINGYLKYRRTASDNGVSMSFVLVDTDIRNAYCDITFTALTRNSYKITLTNASGLADRAGLIVRVNNSTTNGSVYGIRFV
jgi:hypothetical protein